jgi:tRNA/tmRNA/rRNA uracil-C5-methylase (TrmA/RlmC/RlmD family)
VKDDPRLHGVVVMCSGIEMKGRSIFRKFSEIKSPLPLEPKEIIKIKIDSLRSCGHGVVQWNDDWIIKVPAVLPGEVVEIKVNQCLRKEKIVEAELISVIEKSKFRVESVCQYFMTCSGCQFQHIDINFQREWKRNLVFNHLQLRNLKHISVNPVLGTDQIYGYRSKITPTCVFPTTKSKTSAVKIGFFNNTNRQPIDISHCSVASDLINTKYAQYRQELFRQYESPSVLNKKNLRPLLLRESDEPGKYVETNQTKTVTQTVLGYKFQFCANDFFQINSSLLPSFFQYIRQQAINPPTSLSNSNGTTTSHKKFNYLIDTYCGCGVFSILLSPYFKKIVGIDISSQSIRFANINKSLNSIKNISFQHGNANEIFSSVQSFPSDETVVIMDPSRKGSDSIFLSQLFQFSPAKVVYVACDVETQVRDCQVIIENGYEIVDCQPWDMFPQTAHIENVITLEKIKRDRE